MLRETQLHGPEAQRAVGRARRGVGRPTLAVPRAVGVQLALAARGFVARTGSHKNHAL